jgi:ABC-type transporter Mla subunit MlaD
MSDQKTSEYPGSNGSGSSVPTLVSDSTKKELSTLAGEAVSKLAEVAQEAGAQAKETATSLAVEAGENAKRLMNKQVGNSADFIGHVATSVKVAARSLDDHAPQLAKWAQDLAARADEFSASIRYQTVDELYVNASEYARRKPTLVFSAAAACGFLLFRLFKATPEATSQPQQDGSGATPSGSQQPISGQF